MIILKGQRGGHAYDETSPHRCYGFRCGVHRERLRQFRYVQEDGSREEPGDRDLAAGKGLPGTDKKIIGSAERRAETAGLVTGSAKGHAGKTEGRAGTGEGRSAAAGRVAGAAEGGSTREQPAAAAAV